MGNRALIYTRVSQDRAGGRSPAEQEAEARQVCEREGWEVAEVITDSVGASRHSKGSRQGWQRACGLVRDGAVDVLVTWEASRAQRDLAAYSQLRDLCSASSVRWSYSGRTYDLADGEDRFRTGLDALLAEREADEIAKRVQRAIRSNAMAGRPHGRRLFGYRRVYDAATGALVRQEPEPVETLVVEGIFDSYLAGEGIRTIAAALNEAGVTTSTGAAWNDSQVRRVLVNPAYAARRVHRGEVVGEADWPALVDAARFDRVQARLAAQRGAGTRQTRTARLLTGVARCGVCGGRMSVAHDRKARDMYQCRTGFCVARDRVKLDEFVTAVLLARLALPDAVSALAGSSPDPGADHARQRVGELRAQLDSAVDQFTAGHLSASTLAKVEQRIAPMLAAAQAASRHASRPSLDLAIPSADLPRWWAALAPEVRREVVGVLLDAVIVLPTKRGTRRFDPDAVAIEWRRA